MTRTPKGKIFIQGIPIELYLAQMWHRQWLILINRFRKRCGLSERVDPVERQLMQLEKAAEELGTWLEARRRTGSLRRRAHRDQPGIPIE
jgi:hypothetical protein